MKNKKWLQISILTVLLIIGGFTVFQGLFAEKDKIPQVGDKAPNFKLTTLDGEVAQLSDYKGQVVMVNFWGTFCPPCVHEMPLFQEYYEKHKEDGLVILGVNLDEAQVTVNRFVKEYGLTFPILLDKNVVRKQYGVMSYPTTFFVNREGEIEHRIATLIEEHHLRPIMDRMLAVR